MFDIYDLFGINQLLEWGNKVFSGKKEQYTPKEIKPVKFSFRPENLGQYVGQKNVKEQIKLILYKNMYMKPTSLIISGSKGQGKTTLANIVAKELNFDIRYHIGGALTLDNFRKFLVDNQDNSNGMVFFLDEIHSALREVIEYLYPILEDWIMPEGKNLKLKPFVFIGCTTNKEVLVRRFSPLLDRCENILLEPYTINDIILILEQVNDKLYQVNIDREIYIKIAENTRLTPRIAIQWFESYLICQDINKLKKAYQVINNGLTKKDIIILQHLAEISKPVGVEALAMIAGTTKEDYTYIIEPFLLFNSYLTRTARGRLITGKGKQLLGELKSEEN